MSLLTNIALVPLNKRTIKRGQNFIAGRADDQLYCANNQKLPDYELMDVKPHSL
jgi:hypothetical protein